MSERDDVLLAGGQAADMVAHLLGVGQVRRAQEVAESLVARRPDDPDAYVVLARVRLAAEDYVGAVAAGEEAVRLAPDRDVPHAQVAAAESARGRFAAAEASLLRALEIDPGYAPYHTMYARLLHSCGRSALALTAVEAALALDPDDATAHQMRAELLLSLQPSRWAVSEAAVRRALELDPDDADSHAVLGAVHLRARRWREAEECFRSALELDPGNRLALAGLAETTKATSPLYRPFLAYATFMTRAGTAVAFTAVVGIWVLFSSITGVMRRDPELAPIAPWVSAGYLTFCVYTWFAEPVTRWILRRRYPWLEEAARV